LLAHLKAEKSGLQSVPDVDGNVPFIVIEDFKTRGLCGDPEQDKDQLGAKNDFYYFWRNVGRSGKEEKDRGRWGLGKNVFPASSKINTFFGLTIRAENPATMLMGQSVLKVHYISGKRVYPYGFFADIGKDEFPNPLSGNEEVTAFAEAFGLSRGNQTGLSIVIPFPDPEITAEAILAAVLRQYVYPLTTGALEVKVEMNGTETMINQQTVSAIVASQPADLRSELEPMLALASWAITAPVVTEVKKPADNAAPKWSEDSIAEDKLAQLRPLFEKGDRLAFEVPVTVRPKGGNQQASFFRVFIERDLNMGSHRPLFVREGLIVSDAVKGKARGVRALVAVFDKPLATLLGDAENPAHTEWQSRSAHFKDRYQHGSSTLSYVKNSVAELVQLLTTGQEEEDVTTLADVFFLALPPSAEKRKTKDRKPKPGVEPPAPTPPIPPAPPSVLRVTQVAGGFTATTRGPAERARITAAYEVRRGSAFKRYDPADFDFASGNLAIEVENTAILEQGGNTIVLGPLQDGSKLTVKGFDPSRDLVLRAKVEE
jgi:hypothetical protein